ncbi:hypothetical protein FOZ63_007425 [Perkinsus olseni]|uniref:Uncharacterized protein n=1 Tax=Perkinsus olseni TaxID=32597 RepID=A0A7J6QW34_PEROL|nr:hypothetical protein FOZ63_007425 [Perkinsus olseni]KAF4712645.1 hypothetical protein FOZ62_018714 [Perkinsus olseni]
MALRLMILVSFAVVLANGSGKSRTTGPTPCPTTMKPPPCPTTMKPPLCPATMRHVDEFVYHHFFSRVTFLADHDTGLGMIFVECSAKTPYQSGWFRLQPDAKNPASIHVVPPSGPGREAHDAWLAGARAACPADTYDQDDFESFVLNEDGDVYAGFVLDRRWLPYVSGIFETGRGNSQEVGMNIQVLDDGLCDVTLTCRNTRTSAYHFKLVGTGIGQGYEVTETMDMHTLDGLVKNLKEKCPDLPEEYYAVKKWNTVRFASPDAIFVTGNYITDRAYRTS